MPKRALKASFLALYHIVHVKKPHTIGEGLLLPATKDIVWELLGKDAAKKKKKKKMTLSHSLITLWADGLVKWPRTYLLSFWSRWEPANMSHFSWIRAQIYPMRPNCLCTLDLFPRKDLWRKYYFVKHLKEEPLGKTFFFFFKVLDDYTKSNGLEWTRCVGGGVQMEPRQWPWRSVEWLLSSSRKPRI